MQFGLIHGDIKPDNFVIFPSEADFPSKALFKRVQRQHPLLAGISDGPPPITIAGIDFGRSLDVQETLHDVIFIGDTQVSDFRCPPMMEKTCWETQIDLTGLAVSIFTIISLKYPKVKKKVSKCSAHTIRYCSRTALKKCVTADRRHGRSQRERVPRATKRRRSSRKGWAFILVRPESEKQQPAK